MSTLAREIGEARAAILPELHRKSFLTTQSASPAELEALVALAELFAKLDRRGLKSSLFEAELAYALFFDNSTRTKSAWAGATARLGMRPVIVDGGSTQVAHGETARETGVMLGMNAHALGVRHDLILGEGNRFMVEMRAGLDAYLEATGDRRAVPMVNLQCDVDHPTQALADLAWMTECFPEGLRGKKVAVSWAYSPSYAKPLSVPQGLISLLTRFGAHVVLAHPAGYDLMPEVVSWAEGNARGAGGSFSQVTSMDDAFAGAHIVYPKSWGPYELMLARVDANRAGDKAAMAEIERQALARNAEHRDWICDGRRMALTASGNALYMHCLPADIGAEVSAEVMRKYEVSLARQANKKVYVIMALLAAAKTAGLEARLDAVLQGE
ncbi:MAG: knotted carbamoyltransferase YgeW [Candidatus Schekmanbacteria bacterium]|nr:knotted carbamoyltransferase YgeW [Candidatus Schekmanbacteria bacterium]